jgi:hypothetical protein
VLVMGQNYILPLFQNNCSRVRNTNYIIYIYSLEMLCTEKYAYYLDEEKRESQIFKTRSNGRVLKVQGIDLWGGGWKQE